MYLTHSKPLVNSENIYDPPPASESSIASYNNNVLLQVAVVADRALLAVFVLVTAISTAAILLPQLNNLHVGNTPLKPPT